MTRQYLQTWWIFTLCVFACFSQGDAAQPNVILIFADDQGYGDLSCFGSETINTPHIDRLAKEGRKVYEFYGGFTGLHALTGSFDDWLLSETRWHAPARSFPDIEKRPQS
jgi:hypothetical protein